MRVKTDRFVTRLVAQCWKSRLSKPAAIHKGVRTKPRNRSIVAGREPLGLFEPNGPHFRKEPVVDKSWNSVPVGQSLPGYVSQPC